MDKHTFGPLSVRPKNLSKSAKRTLLPVVYPANWVRQEKKDE